MGGLSKDWAAIQEGGLFQGFDAVVVLVVIFEALGGLIVSVVIKHADNILKTLATSLSIVTSSVVSYFLLDFRVTGLFVVGAACIFGSIHLYTVPLSDAFLRQLASFATAAGALRHSDRRRRSEKGGAGGGGGWSPGAGSISGGESSGSSGGAGSDDNEEAALLPAAPPLKGGGERGGGEEA